MKKPTKTIQAAAVMAVLEARTLRFNNELQVLVQRLKTFEDFRGRLLCERADRADFWGIVGWVIGFVMIFSAGAAFGRWFLS